MYIFSKAVTLKLLGAGFTMQDLENISVREVMEYLEIINAIEKKQSDEISKQIPKSRF